MCTVTAVNWFPSHAVAGTVRSAWSNWMKPVCQSVPRGNISLPRMVTGAERSYERTVPCENHFKSTKSV